LNAYEETLPKFEEAAQEIVLIINQEKIKFMRVSKQAFKGSNKIAVGNYCFEALSDFPFSVR
jgi:hypothetical protein